MYKYRFLEPDLPEISECLPYWKDIYKRKQFTNGGYYCNKLESDIGDYLGVKNCIAVANGTDALMLAYKALKIKGKVLVPSFTFPATVSSLVWIGLEPVFVDIDEHTLTIDVKDVENKIDKNTSAIIAVNSFGQPCHIKDLEDIAKSHKIKLIFDSAPALGSEYNGKKLGSFGDVECFSLHATKVLPAGEGGLVTTENDEIASNVRLYRNFGIDYGQVLGCGINCKLSEFHAVIGCQSLKHISDYINKRKKLVSAYKNRLKNIVDFQQGRGSVHQLFPILVESRDELQMFLDKEGVQTRIYYSPLLNESPTYRNFEGTTPTANKIYKNILCLPLHTKLEIKDVNNICDLIVKFRRSEDA